MWNLEDSDDDEVFCGKISLKEVKKYVDVTSNQRRTLGTSYLNTSSEDDNNKSIKIIETHSTPNIITVCSSIAEPSDFKCLSNPCLLYDHVTHDGGKRVPDNHFSTKPVIIENELASYMETLTYQNITNDSVLSNMDVHKSNHSCCQLEKIVTDLSITPNKNHGNGPSYDSDIKHTNSKHLQKAVQEIPNVGKKLYFESKNAKETNTLKSHSPLKTPKKTDGEISAYTLKSNERKLRMPNFKTPIFKTPLSQKKPILTPQKKQFEHVASPVASYINDTPVVPLLRNVRPKKPLNNKSFIPQPIKNPSMMKIYNKENLNLPSTAYRCAKETKVIEVLDKHRMPQSQWAKNVDSSRQKGVVVRHIHRENFSVKTPTTTAVTVQHEENSFCDLTLHQADLSVCTQKPAGKKGL